MLFIHAGRYVAAAFDRAIFHAVLCSSKEVSESGIGIAVLRGEFVDRCLSLLQCRSLGV